MKTLTRLSLIAAVAAGLGTSGAFADDQHLQYRLSMQRAELEQQMQGRTIAVFTGHRGVGSADTRTGMRSSEPRYELRSTPHGQVFGVYVPAR